MARGRAACLGAAWFGPHRTALRGDARKRQGGAEHSPNDVESPCPNPHDVSLPRNVTPTHRWRRRPLLDLADTLPQRRLEVERPAVLWPIRHT
jgi:hypothetical protein